MMHAIILCYSTIYAYITFCCYARVAGMFMGSYKRSVQFHTKSYLEYLLETVCSVGMSLSQAWHAQSNQ